MKNINHHYVPILRTKAGEWNALLDLHNCTDINLDHVTPLIEIIPSSFFRKDTQPIPPKTVLKKISNNIGTKWGYNNFIFVDGWHIDGAIVTENEHPMEYLFQQGRCWNYRQIPVTGINRSIIYENSIRNILSVDKNGLCIRVMHDDFQRGGLTKEISSLLARMNIEPTKVDLLVDLQVIDSENQPDFWELYQRIPMINEWRSFILASGAFFEYPSKVVGPFQEFQWPREDWLYWKNVIANGEGIRIPSYGDYTVQYAKYIEPPEHITPSANIRYTSDDYWILMRGESLRKGQKYGQYPDLAQLLCARKEFSGKHFSAGDKYIFEIGHRLIPGTGSPQTFITAGINRHISYVMYQLSNLPYV